MSGVFFILLIAASSATSDEKKTETPPPAKPAVPEPQTVCRDLTTSLEAVLATPAFEDARYGVHVARVDSGETLFSRNGDVALVPASNVKVVTTAAALHYLGPDYRFRTEVLGDMDARGVITGNLYVRGDGDPTLVPERVWYLANKLYYAGLRQIRGDIIIDDTYFAGHRLANGREQDESSYAYMAPSGAVSVGYNTVLVHVYPGATSGAPPHVMLEPKNAYARVEIEATTISRGRTWLTIDVEPEGARSIVRVKGHITLKDDGRAYFRRIDNPPIYAGEVLRAMLKSIGVAVRGRVKTGETPEKADRLVLLSSPRLAEVVNRVNKYSNNFMAEQLALATGAFVHEPPGTWEKAQAAIETFLNEEVGAAPGSHKVRNGSGLHDVNELSPELLVQVLTFMYEQQRVRPEFLASLAVASSSGTLSSRMRNTDAEGLLRAKTGTLSIASALSGYVTTRSDHIVAFSVLVNDYKAGLRDVWAAQDEVGATLAASDLLCEAQPTHTAGVSSGQDRNQR